MSDKEWFTIKELSDMAGITPQAIYKRLNQKDSTLKPLVKTVKSKKYLNIKALEEFVSTETTNLETDTLNQVERVESSKEIIELLKAQLETTNKQIEAMNGHTEVLRGQLERKDKQIDDLNNRLEQALKNTSEGHFVLAQEQQKKSLVEPAQDQPWYKRIFKKKDRGDE